MITGDCEPRGYPWYYNVTGPPEGMAAGDISRIANRLYLDGFAPAVHMDERKAAGGPAVPYATGTELATAEKQSKPGLPRNPDNMYYFMPVAKKPGSATHAEKQAPDKEIDAIRSDFPILGRQVNGRRLVWLDNAATTQKPKCVMDALTRYYSECNSNVHRGAHTLAQAATTAYEEAREKARGFIGAATKEEIIFVRGTTEGINLVANSWGLTNIRSGDEILLTAMEHHSNIVPWQMLANITGAKLKVIPMDESGQIILSRYEKMFTPRTKLVALAHVSNTLGTVNPVREMINIAHRHGALALIDGAQSAPHMRVDVKEMDADFFAFSGHKCYGPTGIGVLYGKRALLEAMPPYQGGGGMIKSVQWDRTVYENTPGRFEAGTVNIADAVGLGAAIDYLGSLGIDKIQNYEAGLTRHIMKSLRAIPGVRLFGTAPDKAGVISFTVDGVEPETIARILDQRGIAIRAGHHCAQPVLKRYGVLSMARASIGLYNTIEEMDLLADSISEIALRYR